MANDSDDEPLYPPAQWFDAPSPTTPTTTAQPPIVEPVVIHHHHYYGPDLSTLNPSGNAEPMAVLTPVASRSRRVWRWIDPRRWVSITATGAVLIVAATVVHSNLGAVGRGLGVVTLPVGMIVFFTGILIAAVRFCLPVNWRSRVAVTRVLVVLAAVASLLLAALMMLVVVSYGTDPKPATPVSGRSR